MNLSLRTFLKHVFLFGVYSLVGIVLTLLVFLVNHLENRPDLEPWHLVEFDEEFTTESNIVTFEKYLALEDRLFGQLDRLVYDQTGPAAGDLANRFKRGSLTDPNSWFRNWNRSFEIPIAQPRAAVLLLHGLSDSPYSMRSIGEDLNQAGVHVVGLRLPGHGTAPSGLLTVNWRDMAAAVEMAVKDLARRFPQQPVYVVGYSNGAALAVHYTLNSIRNSDLPAVDRLVLLSPEIGVTPLAAFSVWQARLGRLLGLDKIAWNSIGPEYDPYKYNSFAINAADISYQITAEIQDQLQALSEEGLISEVPPILAFSSVVDATVHAPDLVDHLFDRLESGDHALVLYDVNRRLGLKELYRTEPQAILEIIQDKQAESFSLSLVTNPNPESRAVVVRNWSGGHGSMTEMPLDLAWPDDIFSLSHVALPFPENDPLYGGKPDGAGAGINLGSLVFRGERGVLQVSSDAMLRQRWNPFHEYQAQRIREFLTLQQAGELIDES